MARARAIGSCRGDLRHDCEAAVLVDTVLELTDVPLGLRPGGATLVFVSARSLIEMSRCLDGGVADALGRRDRAVFGDMDRPDKSQEQSQEQYE